MTIRTFNNTDILLLRDGYKIMLRLYNWSVVQTTDENSTSARQKYKSE